jgi:tape measure domain-containing protein
VSLNTTNAVFTSVTKAAGVLGLSSADAEASLRALGQMAAKGKVSMEELSQQLGERLPAVLSVTAKGLGLTTGDLTKLIETGKVLADEEFFAAFSRGVDKTFVEGAGKITGMRAEFNRLLGTITEGVQVLAEGAFGQALGTVLGALGTSLQYILFGVAAISERFTVLGQTIGTVMSAVVNRDFANLGAALDDINKRSDDKLGNLASRISGISTASDSASVSVRSTAVAMEEGANRATASAATQVQAATSVAQAHQAVATAVTTSTAAQVTAANATLAAGEVSASAAASWTQLRNSYVQTQGAAEKLISQRTELVKAAKLEGDALLQVAAISGNEVLQREAAVAAAGKQSAAALALVAAEEALLGSQQRELAAMEEYIRINGDATGARQKQVVAQQQEVASIQAKVESARNEAASLDLTLTKRRLEIETIKDNSGRLGELRNAYNGTRQALDDLRLQQQFGLATQAQVTAAEVRSAEAARLLSDAYHDLRASVELKAQSMRADLAISGAKLTAAQAEAQAAVKVAEATGDEVGAIQAKVRIKELEIAAVRSKVAAAQAEYQAEVDIVNAMKADLEQQGLLTPTKELELDIRLRNAKAKLLEAQAGSSAVRAIESEIDALNRRNAVPQPGSGGAGSGGTGSAANDAKLKEINDKYKGPEFKSVTGNTREDRLAGQNATDSAGFFIIQDKLRSGTLSAADAPMVAALQAAVKQNSIISSGANQAAFSTDFLQSLSAQFAVAQTANERLRQLEARDKAKAAQPQTTPAASRTVNISIGGRPSQINVASSADGDALVALLRELETASNRSNGP